MKKRVELWLWFIHDDVTDRLRVSRHRMSMEDPGDKDIWVTEFVKKIVLHSYPPMPKKSASKAALKLWTYRSTQSPHSSAHEWAASR
jgi:hypothetical protein